MTHFQRTVCIDLELFFFLLIVLLIFIEMYFTSLNLYLKRACVLHILFLSSSNLATVNVFTLYSCLITQRKMGGWGRGEDGEPGIEGLWKRASTANIIFTISLNKQVSIKEWKRVKGQNSCIFLPTMYHFPWVSNSAMPYWSLRQLEKSITPIKSLYTVLIFCPSWFSALILIF